MQVGLGQVDEGWRREVIKHPTICQALMNPCLFLTMILVDI